MTDTACVSIYKLDDGYNISYIREKVQKNMFYPLPFKPEIQVINDITIEAYVRFNNDIPDWAKQIRVYLENEDHFDDSKKYSIIVFLFINDDPQKRCFVFVYRAITV